MEDSATLGSDMSAVAGLRGAKPYGIASFSMGYNTLYEESSQAWIALNAGGRPPTETKAINPGGAGGWPPH